MWIWIYLRLAAHQSSGKRKKKQTNYIATCEGICEGNYLYTIADIYILARFYSRLQALMYVHTMYVCMKFKYHICWNINLITVLR